MEIHPKPADTPRAGASLRGALGLAAGVVALLGTTLWMVSGSDSPKSRAERTGVAAPESPTEGASEGGGRARAAVPSDAEPADHATRRSRAAGLQDYPLPPADALGSIRGKAGVPPGVPFPETWSVTLRPSRSMQSEVAAPPRVLQLTDGDPHFRFVDLPAAGYELVAEAPGLVSRAAPVLLSGHALHPFVTINLEPTGFLEGDAIDTTGLAIEHLPVHLLMHGETLGRQTRTDANGHFLFEDVREGVYALRLGDGASPIAQKQALHFHPPSMRVPAFELPVLGQLEFRVTDSAMRSVEGALVQGTSKTGGYVEFTSDADGRGYGHFLPAGRYRFYAHHPEHGRGRESIELGEGERLDLEIVLTPERKRGPR